MGDLAAGSVFICVLGSFGPLCVCSPLVTLETVVLFRIWWTVKTFARFTWEFFHIK